MPFGWLRFLLLSSLALLLAACKVQTTGIPQGGSFRGATHAVTLIVKQEPFVPSPSGRRDPARFGIGLLLHDLERPASPRFVPLLANAPSDFRHSRILGQDGNVVWFLTTELNGYDLASHRRITPADLARRNPQLGDLAQLEHAGLVEGHLRLASRDRRRIYALDPATLRATPAPDSRIPAARLSDDLTPDSSLTRGGFLSTTEWLGLFSAEEAHKLSFQPGSRLSTGYPADYPRRQSRSFQRAIIDPQRRIASIVHVGAPQGWSHSALIAAAPGAEIPLRLAGPDGFLMVHQVFRDLAPRVLISRVDTHGRIVWTADASIGELQQILAHPRLTILRALTIRQEGKLQEPLLVFLDTATGKFSTHSLWLR